MSDCPPSATATAPPDDDYAASKEWFKSKLRQKRREKKLAKGLPVSDDEEPEVGLEEGRTSGGSGFL